MIGFIHDSNDSKGCHLMNSLSGTFNSLDRERYNLDIHLFILIGTYWSLFVCCTEELY
jgi:hypothetical protein